MHDEARMLGQPLLHDGMLVRRIVAGDQLQGLLLGRFAVDLLQELQSLGVGVPLLTLTDDLTTEHAECGKQRRRAVALVIVGHGGRPPLLQRQSGLCAIGRLPPKFRRYIRNYLFLLSVEFKIGTTARSEWVA